MMTTKTKTTMKQTAYSMYFSCLLVRPAAVAAVAANFVYHGGKSDCLKRWKDLPPWLLEAG